VRTQRSLEFCSQEILIKVRTTKRIIPLNLCFIIIWFVYVIINNICY
jgi:hypothetical protein